MRQNRAKIVAITGGIGSGKSTVSAILISLGAATLDADKINRELMEKPDYISRVGEVFPAAIVNGKVDRKLLGNIVFSDPSSLELLNRIVRPMLQSMLSERIAEAARYNDAVFVECPLLFEWGIQSAFDVVWLVSAERQTRTDRVIDRDGRSKEQVDSIMNGQSTSYPTSDNVLVIENNGTIEDLERRVTELYERLIGRK